MKSFDVVIVGAGPAGMAAAIAARQSGSAVAIIDDNHSAGGQIWRGGGPFRAFENCGAEFAFNTRVIDGDASRNQLTIEHQGRVSQIRYSKLILATGAREVFIPFPGWTLPGVFGVGGLQALAKSGLSVQGKTIVVAGSGPLLLAVAEYLVKHGATVPLIAEQAPWRNLLTFGLALLRHPSKISQAVRIKASLSKTKYLPGAWLTKACGRAQIEEVEIAHQGRVLNYRCDYLAVGYGFAPNTELAQLLGCQVSSAGVTVDESRQTSVPGIFCAGEPTGLGGVDKSLFDGHVAGHAASGKPPDAGRRQRIDHFTGALNRAFSLRPELRTALTPETIVCRCEDVSYRSLLEARNWREAKIHFRCGMGPCQGRVCGPAVAYLFGWRHESVRPPIFPSTVQNLIQPQETIHS